MMKRDLPKLYHIGLPFSLLGLYNTYHFFASTPRQLFDFDNPGRWSVFTCIENYQDIYYPHRPLMQLCGLLHTLGFKKFRIMLWRHVRWSGTRCCHIWI